MRLRAFYIAACFLWACPVLTDPIEGDVWLVDLSGPVGPASVDLVIRTIEDANDADREAVIIRMDTPGGLDKAMRDLVQAILASNIPVITYVAPNGARAASAGTYIAYASHIAAMAPATNIGSSTPVSIAPQALPSTPANPGSPRGGSGDNSSANGADQESTEDANKEANKPAPAAPLDAMGRKVINDAVAYLQSLAELRGRNIEWAEETVREGANLRASAALEANVIDLIEPDVQSLLKAVHGRSVEVASGSHIMDTESATVRYIESDWRHDLLATITDPSIAYGLLIIGLYALMLEFYNPGLIIPAMTGIILLLLGAYGLQLLPVNYAGLALVVIGIVLMIAEVMTPTFGVLGVGGLIAFVLGSVMMFDSEIPGYTLPLAIIAAFATTTGAIVFFIVGMAVKARKQPIVSGMQAMLGAPAVVMTPFEANEDHYHGDVLAFGEMWQAHSDKPLDKQTEVRVNAVNGLILDVSEEL